MNTTKLLAVLSKYARTEVTLGPKRGARAARERAPLPIDERPVKVTLEIHAVDSPGRPHREDTYNSTTDTMETSIWTVSNARCGIRVDVFKASEEYAEEFISNFKVKMALPEFLDELRTAGFALLDTGNTVKINSQAGEAYYFEFELSFSTEIKGDQRGGYIDNVSATFTATDGATPHVIPQTFSRGG